jgi:hypothetical protein
MVPQEFKDNVALGDVVVVRSALVEYLISKREPKFQTFDEYLQYAAMHMSVPVIEEYDGRPLEENQEKWDMDYLNRQKFALRCNFCEARIQHVKSVILKVLPPRENSEGDSSRSKPEHTKQGNPSQTGSKVLSETRITETDQANKGLKLSSGGSTALIVGGAAISVAALLLEEPIIVGAGVVVAGIGCAIKLTSQK